MYFQQHTLVDATVAFIMFDWQNTLSWLVYSKVVDGAFCSVCSVFCADTSKSVFMQADLLKQSVENSHTAIAAQLDTRKAANIQRNCTVLKSILLELSGIAGDSALLFVEAVKIWIHLAIQVIFLHY